MPIISNPAIEFTDVSVRYRVPKERLSGIKEFTIRWLQRRVQYVDFWALQDISFAIQPGEVFGVIGHNGAGKSTLLKVMAQVLRPVHGRVVMRGRMAPLLELGGGFHPELTGRENVFMNMALLGHTRSETQGLFDSLVSFAELWDFIDAPLRTYSTGMVARLGFAVATCIRPDILLVDEVLSVGDSQFQFKCLERMYDFQQQGTTIVIVSHSLGALESLCKRALWLDKGRIMGIGPVEEVVQEYISPRISVVEALKTDQPSVAGVQPDLPALAESEQKANHPSSTSATSSIHHLAITDRVSDYVELDEKSVIYPTKGIFNPSAGTVVAWIKIASGTQPIDAVIFHTNDSRYILYISLYYSLSRRQYIRKLVARAAGNRRVIDAYYGSSDFPEAGIIIQEDEAPKKHILIEDEWHMVAMTWDGYPDGRVRLFADGQCLAEKDYDARYDRGDDLPDSLAVGWRPAIWRGEVLRQADGDLKELRPDTLMRLADAGIQLRGLRLYQHALGVDEIRSLWGEGRVA